MIPYGNAAVGHAAVPAPCPLPPGQSSWCDLPPNWSRLARAIYPSIQWPGPYNKAVEWRRTQRGMAGGRLTRVYASHQRRMGGSKLERKLWMLAGGVVISSGGQAQKEWRQPPCLPPPSIHGVQCPGHAGLDGLSVLDNDTYTQREGRGGEGRGGLGYMPA